MGTIKLRIYDEHTSSLDWYELPLDATGSSCTIDLQSPAGASALHLLFANDTASLLRVEIDTEGSETLAVRIDRDGRGLRVSASARSITTLVTEESWEPVLPVVPNSDPKSPLDLVFLIDGTARLWPALQKVSAGGSAPEPPAGDRLMRHPQWSRHVDDLLKFLDALGDARDRRVAVVAFGDDPIPGIHARDLQRGYRTYPPAPRFQNQRPSDTGGLRKVLLEIPPSSGGDFVDALADAFALCLPGSGQLKWRENARKLIVLSGDSPGHSVLNPGPIGSDALIRRTDVDSEASNLQAHGIELLTIFHDPPADTGIYDHAIKGPLFDHARRQYASLASRPELHHLSSSFEPKRAASAILAAAAWARGPSYPMLPTGHRRTRFSHAVNAAAE